MMQLDNSYQDKPKSGNSKWVRFLVARSAVHLVLGTLVFAVWGALLVSMAGGLTGLILDGGVMTRHYLMTEIGAGIGVVFGGIAGGVLGLICFLLVGIFSPPRHNLWPPRVLWSNAMAGMLAMVIALTSLYFVYCLASSLMAHINFLHAVGSGLFFLMFAVPAAMACGLVGGVVWGFDRHRRMMAKLALNMG